MRIFIASLFLGAFLFNPPARAQVYYPDVYSQVDDVIDTCDNLLLAFLIQQCLVEDLYELSSRQHTAHALQFEITVHYRFHPRYGERLGVVKTQTYRGERAYVVEQHDGSLTLLPMWMTEPAAADFQIVSSPRISLDALIELRRIVDAAVLSRNSKATDGGEDERSEIATEELAAERTRPTATAGRRKQGVRTAGATATQRSSRGRNRGRKAR